MSVRSRRSENANKSRWIVGFFICCENRPYLKKPSGLLFFQARNFRFYHRGFANIQAYPCANNCLFQKRLFFLQNIYACFAVIDEWRQCLKKRCDKKEGTLAPRNHSFFHLLSTRLSFFANLTGCRLCSRFALLFFFGRWSSCGCA